MAELEEQIKVVAVAREQARKATADRNSSYAEWEVDNTLLLNRVRDTYQQANEAEAKLRELTLQAYAETGNKAPEKGVGIREVTKLDYDPALALNWAMEHQIYLKLDVSTFEKIAKASPIPFVRIYQEPQAIIAKELEVDNG